MSIKYFILFLLREKCSKELKSLFQRFFRIPKGLFYIPLLCSQAITHFFLTYEVQHNKIVDSPAVEVNHWNQKTQWQRAANNINIVLK